MTTKVQIVMPNPNHQRVRVDVMDLNHETGEETGVAQSIELAAGQVSEEIYVHSTRGIKITEID